MDSKLYIRNLSSSTTEQQIRNLFTLSGTVVMVDIIKDRLTGRSKGYGFIQMSSPAEAERAVETFNGWSLDNSALRVGLAPHHRRRSLETPGSRRASGSSLRRGYVRYG